MKKILFYYHHFGGLGHGTRINALCKAIKSHNPYYKIVVLNSGKPQPELKIGKYAKVIDLPYFEAKEGLFSGLSSQESIETTFKKRKAILYAIAEQFKPDLAIFEHFPFGRNFLGKEIIDLIKKLKYQRTLIYSSVRDIIEQEVDENKLDKRLDFFNGIFVHSDKETGFTTSFEQSEKLKDKLIFTGRAFAESREKLISKDKIRKQLSIGNNKLIVASIGGGNDGCEILNKLIRIKKEIDNVSESLILITTGNSISKSEFEKLKEKAKTKKDILITKFNPNYFDYLNAADISISMGGYNSINNALLTDTQTIIVPRDSDSEQKIRAKIFSDFFKIMTFEDLRDNDKLRDMILKLLQPARSSQYINIKQKDNFFSKLISS
ncbi:MAG: hypothetical protein KAS15_00115, partial [Nanoarchaeota archaeon]|nr:hypothetical protein [Nanoarchaeota archaeon]